MPSLPIKQLFSKHFFEHYIPRYCDTNSLHFLKEIAKKNLGISDFYLVKLKNKGVSSFGLVNAEIARPSLPSRISGEESNWYHHTFVMDKHRNVYDFDFTSTPTILPFKEYAEKMFLEETECFKPDPRPSEICGGRTNKLREYEFSLIPAPKALDSLEEAEASRLSMEELLNSQTN